jgi:pimeloyl-ACP methyl ester carboxylesterase
VPVKLAYDNSGSGQPLIILHGLFGCKENWRYPARQLGQRFRVFTLDQRNHGQSPHCTEFGYQAMADDLLAFLNRQKLAKVHLLGHSMGGKTAMQFAACHPHRLNKLIVEDMAPLACPPRHLELFAALDQLPLAGLKKRSEADRLLQPEVPDPTVRRFLLKNLQRQPDGSFTWRFNLPVLNDSYPELIAGLEIDEPIEIPTLFIGGERSDYLPPSLLPATTAFFTNARMATIAEAGHWVHADQASAFLQAVNAFLDETDAP